MAIEIGSTIPFTAKVGVNGGGNSYLINDEAFPSYEIYECDNMFRNKRVVLFALPGAFTPVCSAQQLPDFESKFAELTAAGVEDVYCISVNDPYVVGSWETLLEIQNVKLIADVDGTITESLGMMVDKSNLGMGKRSWRYAAVGNNGVVEQVFEEPGMVDNCETDPYIASTPSAVLLWLKSSS